MADGNDSYFGSINDVAGEENLIKFETFFQNRYLDPFLTGYAFIFITRPSLFILNTNLSNSYEVLAYDNMRKDPLFAQFIVSESANNSDMILAKQLSYHISSNTYGSFLPIFTNRLKSFSPSDVTMEQRDAYETKQGYKVPLPTFKTQSEALNTLSINFAETANLDLTKIMTLWVNYISNITDGTFHANPEMVRKGIVDYMSSIYYFVLEPDARTLKYWVKYTGCWPTTIPFSILNYTKGEQSIVDIDLQFVYTIKEEMNPAILEDFNKTSLKLEDTEVQKIKKDFSQDYVSITESPYLAEQKLENIITKLNHGLRGPIVFFNNMYSSAADKAISSGTKEGNASKKVGHFELAFNKESFENLFAKNRFGSEYVFEENDLLSDLDK